ncbi:hypothetical protein ZIOFF_005673 [Zingiber officinale]|uniref:dUTP diphosphatase n=1 Tax=Zingiber officinale TaxID=94328 RepID=A0A8J5I1P1_ZINOF|nr:hypothetical protein ZIOFF_005673 [Zingiber officinale]
MDGRTSLSFNNYTAAPTPEQPKYNDKDEEILAVWIETKPRVYVYYDGEADDYYEEQKSKHKTGRWDTLGQPSGKFDYYVNYDIPDIPSFPEIPPTGWDDEVGETNNSQKEESIVASERYSSTTEPHILINKITPNAVTPSRQSEGSVGLNISASHAAVIEPYGRDLIHTGLRIEIPYRYYGRLASRSGLAWKTGIEVGAGVIDSDYRGEVQVLLFNRTNLPIYISPQQKVAQLILEKIAIPEVYEVPHLSHTERGNKGFGSTEVQNQITLIPEKETTAVLVQDDSFLSNFEQDHAVDTSPGVAVPWSMDPTLNYQDLDDSYLDYIQYLSTLSGQQPPQWDNSPDSEDNWTNPFASEGGGRQEAFIQLNPQECDKFIELIAANVEMEYPCLRRLVEEVSPATEQIYSISTTSMTDETNADGSSWSATIVGKLIHSYSADDPDNGQPRDRWRDSPLLGHGDELPRRDHVCRPVIIGRDGRAIPVDMASFDLPSHPLPQLLHHHNHHHERRQDQYDNMPIGSVLGRGKEEYVHGVGGLKSAEEACSHNKKANEWWSKPWPVVDTSSATSAPSLMELSERLRSSVVSDQSSKSDEKNVGKFVW